MSTEMTPVTTEAAPSLLDDGREERGRKLARDKRIARTGAATWSVPASESGKTYVVNTLAATCSCKDWELRRSGRCKHLWAVEFVRTVETAPDGSETVTESVRVTRKTYRQPWPEYNRAQCEEKATVQRLLRDLCEGIHTPPHPGRGQRPLPLADVVYAMVMRVYTGMSARRATSDIKASADEGHIDEAPHYNSVINYFNKPEMIPLLTTLIEESAVPLAVVETKFAVDSTGLSTCTWARWYDAKYGRQMKEQKWIKVHAAVGTITNVITAVRVTDSSGNDSPEFAPLVESTARRFNVAEVSGDKAYLSHANLAAVEAVGAVPYVPFKSNSRSDGPAAWRRMWATFMLRSDEFLKHYHQRSNSESTFSALKRKFGASLRSKHYTAQVVEALCKVLCFNLSMLVHAIHELGIEPMLSLGRGAGMAA